MFTRREFDERRTIAPNVRRRMILVLLGVVGLIVALVVTGVVRAGDTRSELDADAGDGASSNESTTDVPRELEWRLVHGVRLPFGPDGPADPDRGTGYSHTPQGAVLAAWQLSSRLLLDPQYEHRLVDARGDQVARQTLRDQVTRVRNFSAEQFEAFFRRPIGFRIEHCDDLYCDMYFATQSPQGGYDFQRRTVLWNGTDWVYQLTTTLPALQNSTGISGFTTFG